VERTARGLIAAGRPAAAAEVLTAALPAFDRDTVRLRALLGAAVLAAGRGGEAIAILTGVVADDPAAPMIRLTLAEALEAEGRCAEAWAELRLAFAATVLAEPTPPALLAPETAADLATLAEALLAAGEGSLARAAISLALAHAPEQATLLLTRARLALAERKGSSIEHGERAEADLRRALMLDPGLAAAHLLLGERLVARGELEEAEHHLTCAIAAAPGQAEAHWRLGDLWRRRRAPERAEAAYRRALAEAPDDVQALHGLSAVLRDAGRLGEALPVAQRAAKAAPEAPWHQVQVGNILALAGHAAEAVQAYRTALGKDARLPGVAEALGRQLIKLGRTGEAAGVMALVASERPSDPGPQREAGRLYLGAGRPADAAPWLRRALARAPDGAGFAAAAEVAEDRDLLRRSLLACGRRREVAADPALRAPDSPGAGDGKERREGKERRDTGQGKRRDTGQGKGEGPQGVSRCVAGPGFVSEPVSSLPARTPPEPVLPAGTPADDTRLIDALHRMPFAGEQPWTAFTCRALTGGVHNTLYHLSAPGREVVLRLERFGVTPWYIYTEETRNLKAAHGLGIGPAVLASDAADGTLMLAYVGGETLTPARFQDEAWLDRAAALYRTLHRGPAFGGRFNIFGQIDTLRRRFEPAPPDGFADLPELGRTCDRLRALLDASRPPPAPCHNDPAAQNFIASGERLILVDWQCSGQADPEWELGSFAAEADLTDAQTDRFLTGRFGTAAGIGPDRVRLYQVVSEYYWTLRCIEESTGGKDGPGWLKLAAGKLARLHARLGTAVTTAARERVERLCGADAAGGSAR